jgi:predicted transcriptional regulator
LWFTRGFVEYQFPNNAKLAGTSVQSIELAMELSSEVPGTSKDWPSDITVAINGHEIDTWTSPGDYGDKRGKFTPDWWKLPGRSMATSSGGGHKRGHLPRWPAVSDARLRPAN